MRAVSLALVCILLATPTGAAQAPGRGQATPAKPPAQPAPAGPAIAGAVTPPAGYVIGPDAVLIVMFWREKDMSAETVVRPDGMITLPLLNDIKAAGLTPDQLREVVEKAAAQYVEEPNATVAVKQINSRRVFITGNVAKPGTYPLTGATTVLQLIAIAGGLTEYADEKGIAVMRVEGGRTSSFKFNYKDVTRGRKLEQNIELKPGDTVVVP